MSQRQTYVNRVRTLVKDIELILQDEQFTKEVEKFQLKEAIFNSLYLTSFFRKNSCGDKFSLIEIDRRSSREGGFLMYSIILNVISFFLSNSKDCRLLLQFGLCYIVNDIIINLIK